MIICSLKTLVEKSIDINAMDSHIHGLPKSLRYSRITILKALEEWRIDYRYSNIIRNIYEKATTAHLHATRERGSKLNEVFW